MLEKEYKYFETHRDEFIKKYKGKYIVIKSQEILGIYDSMANAIKETTKEHELGTFLVQQCVPEEQNIQHFHTRVAFR
jgi:hypothetical protein